MGVPICVRVDLSLGNLDAVVEDNHLHLPASIVDPGEDIVVDGVDTCTEQSAIYWYSIVQAGG